MADMPFNIALGRAVEFYNRVESNDPANSAFIVVLLKLSVVDDTLADFDDLSALLLDVGNTEADFTNYVRKTVTDTELDAFPAPDDVNNRFDIDFPDQTWTAAGGATDNTMTKMLICYDSDTAAGTDANIVPVAHYDFTAVTDGSNLTVNIDAAGFYRASR